MNFKVELPEEMFSIVMRGLMELPFKISAPVIQHLNNQRKLCVVSEKKEKVDNG